MASAIRPKLNTSKTNITLREMENKSIYNMPAPMTDKGVRDDMKDYAERAMKNSLGAYRFNNRNNGNNVNQ